MIITLYNYLAYIFLFLTVISLFLVLYALRKGKEKLIHLSINTMAISVFVASLMSYRPYTKQSDNNNDLRLRIESLTTTLQDCSTELLEIENLLVARIQYVDDLKQEAEVAENIASISSEQVAAIQAKLSEELNANNSKNFIPNILNNLLFCILGAVFLPLLTYLWSKLKKEPAQESESNPTTYSDEEIAQAIKLLNTVKQNSMEENN